MMVTETNPRRGLIVGNYCHDILFKDNLQIAQTLGGASSFISTLLDLFPVFSCHVYSKVGPDFLYARHVSSHPPTISLSSSPTTLFHAHFHVSAGERMLKRVHKCDPISPDDLPQDDRLGFLKASAEEAPFVDVEEARKHCCVVVTNGKDGCTLYWKDGGECRIPAFPAVEVDPTGAGDCFLGGFAAGFMHGGLSVPDAALLGNLFGSLTVAQIGIPKFNPKLLQQVNDELERRKTRKCCCGYGEIMKQPSLLVGCDYDGEFRAYLLAAVIKHKQFLNDDEDIESHFCNHQNKLFVSPVLEEPPVQALNINP